MLAYLRFNLGLPGINWRTCAFLLCDGMHNLYFLLTTYLNMYIVDVLFSSKERSKDELFIKEPHTFFSTEYPPRELSAFVVAFLYVFPFLCLHWFDILKVHVDLSGFSQDFLQKNLFRKYLNYDESARINVTPANMSHAVLHTCEVVGDAGFAKCVGLVRLVSKLTIIGYFVLKENKASFPALIVFPALMVVWAYCRAGTLARLEEEVGASKKRVLQCAHDVSRCYPLVADYAQRPAMCDRFAECITDLHKRRVPYMIAWQHSNYFPLCLSTVAIGLSIGFLSPSVLSGEMSLGTFLALIRILSELGREFKEAYVEIMEVFQCVSALRTITRYMNASTDLLHRREAHLAATKTLCQKRRDISLAKQGVTGDGEASFFNLDIVPIALKDLRFRFNVDGKGWLIEVDRLQAPQGSMVALVGAHKSGKTTFLKLLTQVLFPKEGQIFVPTHLRVLHVTDEPFILETSLWENLTFGDSSAELDRVLRILDRLELHDLSQSLNDESNRHDVHSQWWNRLSNTDIAKIHVARALIANTEVLAMQRPCTKFDSRTADLVMDMLGEYIENRGVEMEGRRDLRRPRTCFYTTDYPEIEAAWADLLWEIKDGHVERISHKGSRDENGHARGSTLHLVRRV